MKYKTALIILAIFFNGLIPIAIDHNIGVLFFSEILGPAEFFNGNVKFSIFGKIEDELFTAGTFALIGQIILLASLFIRKAKRLNNIITVAGMVVLYCSFTLLYLADYKSNTILICAVPFFITSFILLFINRKLVSR